MIQNPRYPVQNITQSDRNIAFLLFALLLILYLITFTGVIQSSDGLAMFSTTESMVRRGAIDSNQLIWMGNQQGNSAADGNLYSRKGLGMTLLGLPLVWLARWAQGIGLVHSALLLNPLLTAFTGALIFGAGRRLSWMRSTSVAVALIYGLATMAWPYTQTYFSDPVCAFGLFGAFYGILSYGQTGRKYFLLLAGLAWSIAYLTRVANLITLPLYLIAVYVVVVHRIGYARLQRRGLAVRVNLIVRRYWRPFVSFLAPVVIAGLMSLWWNWVRYGNVLQSGYVETERFNAVWWFGVSGLLVGPARGLFWYSPILLLAIPGAVWFWRHARMTLYFVLAFFVIYVLFYGKWYMWHGGYSWGPRFIVPTLPFLALLAGPAIEKWLVRGDASWLARLAVGALITVSVVVQWLGMLVPFALVQDWLDAAVQPLFAPETFTRLQYSPLVLQWQFITSDNVQLAWWRATQNDRNSGWSLLILLLLAAGLLVYALGRQLSSASADEGHNRQWIVATGLVLVIVIMLTVLNRTITDPDLREAASRIREDEAPSHAVLITKPESSQPFANVYHGRLPAYGVRQQSDVDEFTEYWTQRIRAEDSHIWLLPDETLPESSTWERTLRLDDFLLSDERMSPSHGQRLAFYAINDPDQLVQVGLGTVFGDPMLIESGIDDTNGWIRLRGYAMLPETHPGGDLLLQLDWESLQAVNDNYHVFVHLLNADGDKLAQRDGQPVQWMRPTSTWQPGEIIEDRYGMHLPQNMPEGDYVFSVGLYNPVTGQRLPVSAGPSDYAIELGPIHVSSAD